MRAVFGVWHAPPSTHFLMQSSPPAAAAGFVAPGTGGLAAPPGGGRLPIDDGRPGIPGFSPGLPPKPDGFPPAPGCGIPGFVPGLPPGKPEGLPPAPGCDIDDGRPGIAGFSPGLVGAPPPVPAPHFSLQTVAGIPARVNRTCVLQSALWASSQRISRSSFHVFAQTTWIQAVTYPTAQL